MFESIDEIYEHIGQSMYNALPDEWDIAYLDMRIIQEGRSSGIKGTYFINGERRFYSVDTIDGEAIDSKCDHAFYALYKMMKRNDTDMPWNKARFELEPDGSFDLQFKLDKDFIVYKSLDADSPEFDSLSSDFHIKIESWEGLPEDMPRPWKVD